MIQFNLLPDVKLEFVKARRGKRFAITVSVIASIAALAILLVLFLVVDGLQKKSLSNLNNNIKSYTAQINNTPGLNKVLTIQNQIQALPALEAQRPAVSRLFTYISQVTPSNISINNLAVSFEGGTWDIIGSAPNLATIDQFIDTLKFTTYTIGNNHQSTNAFSDVVLDSFGVDSNTNTANYTINADFAPAIFNASDNVTLTVPNIISTRSETQQPQDLFVKPTAFFYKGKINQ